MNDYKQRLDTHLDLKKNNDMNQLRMTKNEKKLNYNDLQAYKDIDPSMYAMIPGWSPQIGALKAPKIDPVAASCDDMNQTKNAKFSPNVFSAKTCNFIFHGNFFFFFFFFFFLLLMEWIVVQNHFNKGNQNAMTLPTDEGVNKSELNENKSKTNLTLLYGHNPILNPTPHNIQNPYLAKEFAQRKNFLSQMGQNSLI